MMTFSVSTKKKIREMDSTELEEYISVKFNKFCNRDIYNLREIAKTNNSDIAICLDCYKQLTGKDFDFNTLD
jgi:hypothetical protein